MLVLMSDLHLTDGSSGETIHAGAFAAFRQRLSDLAYDASWRADGKYKPILELHVVLLGDVLDVIRSCKWLDGGIRPWSRIDTAFSARVSQIAAGILDNNKDSLAILRSLADGQTITIPDVTTEGKPARVSYDPGAPGRVAVKVSIHYVVGNHDWFFHVAGEEFDRLRNSIASAMGLATPPAPFFPHDPIESEQLTKIFREHRIWARHGDVFDSMNYEHDRNASSLGDAIVVELLNRFPDKVCKLLGADIPKACALGLREIDNVRPLLVVPIWINGLLRRTCSDAVAKKIKAVWDNLVDDFLSVDFVRKHNTIFQLFDDVSKLEWALKFSRGVSLGNLSELMTWIQERVFLREGGFYPNAFTEQEFKNRNARFIVYGHTHNHEIVPLDATVMSDGSLLEQMYINSGTWRAVHEQTQLHPAEQEFMGYHVMTYLAFFKGDERKGRAFESWSGALTKS
jgi:UDP-2,3-diacylglucosamine pyrophosphatase LpxH